jgi:hypothetical protein
MTSKPPAPTPKESMTSSPNKRIPPWLERAGALARPLAAVAGAVAAIVRLLRTLGVL